MPRAIFSFVLIFLLTVSAQTVDAHTFFWGVVFFDSVTLRNDAGRVSVCQTPPNNSKQLLNCWSLLDLTDLGFSEMSHSHKRFSSVSPSACLSSSGRA